MWRALFLATGIFIFLVGLECLLIDHATVNRAMADGRSQVDDITPPEWAPWSFMSAGAVVVLYSFTLPQKLRG